MGTYRTIARLALASVLLCALAVPSPARAVNLNGCSVVVVGHPGFEDDCIFTVTGPVYLVAATTSGWRVQRSHNFGEWLHVASSAGRDLRPTQAHATVEKLPAIPMFDRVRLSIVPTGGPAGIQYQHGFIAATSDL